MRQRFGWVVALVLSATVLAAVFFRPITSMAETATTPAAHTIDVTGQGKLTIKYDTATLNLGFTTVRDTPTGAYRDMSDTMNKVVEVLKQMGIQEDDMKTGTFSLNTQTDWNNGSPKVVGYQAANTLAITTQKLDQVAILMQAAVEAGANQVNGVNFSIKDTDALLNQALDLAVDDARAKADRVAKRLGAEVGGVAKVTVQDNGRPPIFFDNMAGATRATMAASAAVPAPVYAGTGDYTATVSVTFELK